MTDHCSQCGGLLRTTDGAPIHGMPGVTYYHCDACGSAFPAPVGTHDRQPTGGRRKPKADDPPRLALDNVRILIIEYASAGYWGKAQTWDEAHANAHKPKYYQAYICHVDTYVDGMMPQIVFPTGFDPILIRDVKPPVPRKRKAPAPG